MEHEVVSALGYDIPVWDYYTAGEREALEALISTQDDEVRGRYDVEAFRIFLRTRLQKDVKVPALLTKPVYGDELAEAVEVLCGPLFEILKQRAFRRERKRVAELKDPAMIKATLERYEELVENLKRKLDDNAGHD